MGIRFHKEDWARVREAHQAWWRGELSRPLVQVRVREERKDAGPCPAAPVLSQENCTDFSHTPEALIERLDYELSQTLFLGDSFPIVNFNSFGPGVAAAFCGARLSNESGRVWFFPEEEKPVEEISIRYDPENVWVRRIKDIYRAGGERWKGNVLMTLPDLGGVMDIVATFAGTENLLLALYDEPDQVKRLVGEARTAFMAAYRDLYQALEEAGNPGCSDWDGLYSDAPSYVLQSDFSYMIGPDMFKEFVFDELQASCRELVNVIYHMDGLGQLPHLPQLLKMENLKAIQWVQGDGQRSGAYWMDVYRQIVQSGRGCQVSGSPEEFLEILREIPRGLYYNTGLREADTAREFLASAGVR